MNIVEMDLKINLRRIVKLDLHSWRKNSSHILILIHTDTCTSGRCNRQSEFTLLHFTIFQ